MNKFLKRVALFFIPIILLAFIADTILTRTLRKSRKDDFAVWNDLFNGKVNSEIVIYGSSRAWVQINPKIIEDSTQLSVYNLGIDGHNFYMELLRHNILLKNNNPPQKIIFSLDCFTLYKREDLYNDQQFLAYLNDSLIKAAITTYKGYTKFDFILPIVKHIGKKEAINVAINLIASGFKHNLDNRYKGFAGQNAEWNRDLELALANKEPYIQRFDTSSFALFDNFLNECRTKNIEIIFVYSPEQVEGQKFVKNRDEVFNYFKFYANKYTIPFLDYSNDTMCLHKNYFYNSQHLNKKGADIFTQKLVHDMIDCDFITYKTNKSDF